MNPSHMGSKLWARHHTAGAHFVTRSTGGVEKVSSANDILERSTEGLGTVADEGNQERGSLCDLGIVFFSALLLYLWTICPTIGFGDTAIMIDAMARVLLNSQVNTHPFTVLIGALAVRMPFGELALRANLVSALFGALTVTMVFLAARIGGASRLAAFLGCMTVAVVHSLWWHSTVVENYAATAFLIASAYCALLQFHRERNELWLYIACLIGGLSIFNHVQNSFLCLGIAFTGCWYGIRSGKPWRTIFLCFLFALAGLIPWLIVLTLDIFKTSGDVSLVLRNAFVGVFENTFFSAGVADAVLETALITWNQSPLFLLPICAVIGVRRLVLRDGWYPAIAGMLVHIALTVIVFSGYPTWDRFAFLLAAYLPLSIFAVIGVDQLLRNRRAWIATATYAWCIGTVAVCAVLYNHASQLADLVGGRWFSRFGRGYSYHLYNQGEFIANPNKRGYRDVERYANAIFEKLPQGSLLLDDDSRTYYPLADYYQRHLGRRRDISMLLVNSWGISGWGMSQDDLATRVERAYFFGTPFFITTLTPPYRSFLKGIESRIPLSFDKYPLSIDTWIYKMVPYSSTMSGILKLRDQGKFSSLLLRGGSGKLNIELRHIAFSIAAGTQQQNMSAFGRMWAMDDQVFVKADNVGARIDLLVQNDTQYPVVPSLTLTTAPDFGTVSITFGSAKVGPVDLYSPSVNVRTVELPELPPNDPRLLTLRVVSTSPSSTGYSFGIDTLSFH